MMPLRHESKQPKPEGQGEQGVKARSITEAQPDAENRQFLEQFEEGRQSLVASFFYAAARAGESDPEAIVCHVRQTVYARAAKRAMAHDEAGLRREQQVRDEVIRALQSAPEQALAFAQHVLEWEALPPAERQKQKVERAGHYRAQYLAKQSATEAQIGYLRALGYTGPDPESKQAASEAIEALKAGRARR
jgi:hypothetical protein